MAIAAIVAGGTGSRMGSTEMPKQFLDLCGKPVIIRTIEAFENNPSISAVIVGINPDWYDYMKELAEKYFSADVYITKGGEDRNGTILNIIRYAENELGADTNEILVTHDAVRPFVTDSMIGDSISALDKYDITTAAVPATDTIAVSYDGENAEDFPVRDSLIMIQTPQSFRLGSFRSLLETVSDEERRLITDACRLFMISGKKVGLIKGDAKNIKLTYPSDMKAAKAMLEGTAEK